jgi:hypothetical protein
MDRKLKSWVPEAQLKEQNQLATGADDEPRKQS